MTTTAREDELQFKDPEKIEAQDDGYEEELPEEPKTKPGDIYDLGRHRLICGSPTDYGHVEKVLESELIDLVITDPPYNVAYKGGTKDKLTIKNDDLPSEEFESLLRKFYMNAFAFMKEGAGIYVFHADSEGEKFRRFFREANLKLTQCLIWLKNSFVFGRQDYQWRHEPVLFGGKEYTILFFMDGKRERSTDGTAIGSRPPFSSSTGLKEMLNIQQ